MTVPYLPRERTWSRESQERLNIRMQFYGNGNILKFLKSHTGSNVPRVNKVRAGLLPLWHPVKSKLEVKETTGNLLT